MVRKFNPKFRVKFMRSQSVDKTPIDEGNFIATPENGEVMLDMGSADRVVVGNLQFVDTLEELMAITKPLKKVYFCNEDNCGYIYNFEKSQWQAKITYYPQWSTLD